MQLVSLNRKERAYEALSVSERAVGSSEPGLDQRLRVDAVAPTEGAGDSYASFTMPIARSPSESTLGSLVTGSDRGRKRLLRRTLDLGISLPKVPQENHTISR